jgi:hypothetical protein
LPIATGGIPLLLLLLLLLRMPGPLHYRLNGSHLGGVQGQKPPIDVLEVELPAAATDAAY